jgi:hypothetical protein
MNYTRFISGLFVIILLAAPFAQEKERRKGGVQVPPLYKGGIAGLWYREHEFIEKEYGKFELLNFGNVKYRIQAKGITDTTWKLTAMGNFLREGIQYATLARLKNEKMQDGVLLIMFEWVDPSDTTKEHGIFYRTFISKEQLLLRTKQSGTGKLDTLEFSCADVQRTCGKLYLDSKAAKIALNVTGQD